MNIVISSLNADGIKLISTELTDIDSIKLFISKDILNPEEIYIAFKNKETSSIIYPLEKQKMASLDKNAYFGYRVVSYTTIPQAEYKLLVNEIEVAQSFLITDSLYRLDDEHEPIYIIGRKINPITTQIIAQDANSQQFTFYIKNKYDGISFLMPGGNDDQQKKIYIDFIPVDKKKTLEDGTLVPMEESFLSDEIVNKRLLEQAPNGKQEEWIVLKWDLPYDATRLAGSVKFALAVIDGSDDTRVYTWQTSPASFTVSANLGFRSAIVNVSEPQNSLFELTKKVDQLETLVGFQSDEYLENDEEVILDGGGAPREEGE